MILLNNEGLASNIYRYLLGGPYSDKLLAETTIALLGNEIPNSSIIDIGVGNASNSKKYLELNPRSYLATDYQVDTVRRVEKKLSGYENVSCQVLDLNAEHYEAVAADIVICNSVLMHLEPRNAFHAIRKLTTLLKPGGRLLVGVICSQIAEKCYIAAPGKGQHAYFPALKGFEGVGEDEIPEAFHKLLEYYPPYQLYQEEMQNLESQGFSVARHQALIESECACPLYGRFPGEPLWRLWIIRKP